jgi:hypothetical protein
MKELLERFCPYLIQPPDEEDGPEFRPNHIIAVDGGYVSVGDVRPGGSKEHRAYCGYLQEKVGGGEPVVCPRKTNDMDTCPLRNL